MSTKQEEIDRLIEQFDPDSSFRRLAGLSAKIVMVICASLSLGTFIPQALAFITKLHIARFTCPWC